MMELVFWSFVVTLPPLVLSVVVRIVSVIADLFARCGWWPVSMHRHSQPTYHCVGRRVRRPESFGHGV